jgi:hypothetical protein
MVSKKTALLSYAGKGILRRHVSSECTWTELWQRNSATEEEIKI